MPSVVIWFTRPWMLKALKASTLNLKLPPFRNRHHLVERHVGNVIERSEDRGLPEGIGSRRSRRVRGENGSSVLQRDLDVVRAVVRRAGRIVDRRLIRSVIRRKTGDPVRRIVDQRRRNVAVEPLVRRTADAAAAIRNRDGALVHLQFVGRSPVCGSRLKGLRDDVADRGELKTTDQRIDQAIRITKEALALADGQIHNAIEADAMGGNGGVHSIVFVAVQLTARLQDRSRIHSLRQHTGRKQLGRIEDAIPECVSSNAERFRNDVKNLIGVPVLKRALVIELERTVV